MPFVPITAVIGFTAENRQVSGVFTTVKMTTYVRGEKMFLAIS
jgi:hypothetical protein